MKRPSFAVVSYCLATLSVFGVVIDRLRSHIPLPEPNRLQFETQDFLVQGARSGVDWRTLEPDAFSEARRSGKPIMLLIGTPWSKAARDADAYVFSDKDLISFLNRYSICIRIDGQAEPKWLSAFLPISRIRTPMMVGYQVWFLTPEGDLFDNAGESGTVMPQDAYTFTGLLVRARERLRSIRKGGAEAPVPGAEQIRDRAALVEPSLPVPIDETSMVRDLAESRNLALGGVPRFGRVHVKPGAIRYLLITGKLQEAQNAIVALLMSPLVDWLDGGIYRTYVPGPNRIVEFDKSTLANAELMSVLAEAEEAMPDGTARKFGERIFDMLSELHLKNSYLVGCQVGDEKGQSRSPRNSFTPRRLREVLTPAERVVARERLSLRVEENRVMSVVAKFPPELLDPSTDAAQVLEKLRNSRQIPATFAGPRQLDVHGYAVARMLECARLWNDSRRLVIADDLYSRIDRFRGGDDVQHSLESGVPNTPFLGDYLAYADASLQHFLAMGRVDSLERGARVLDRARELFESGTPGVWRLTIPRESKLWPQGVDVPEVVDFVRESCTAMAIRLCQDYGRLLRSRTRPSSPNRELAIQLLQTAQTTVGQNSAVLRELGVEGAGLLCASIQIQDDRHAVAVGPRTVARASALQRRVPHRLVFPAIGPVRPSLQSREPGFYVVSRTGDEGPFSEDEAYARLRGPARP